MSSLSISANLNALNTRRDVSKGSRSVSDTLEKLSSDLSVSEPSGDGLSLSRSSDARIRGSAESFKNLQDGISRLQLAGEGTRAAGESLDRVRSLVADATGEGVSPGERSSLGEAIDEELDRMDEAVRSIRFEENALLGGENGNGPRDLSLSTGPDPDQSLRVGLNDLTPESLGVDELDVSGEESARDSLQRVSEAINQVATQRADIDRARNQMESALDVAQIQRENESASRSRIRDADRALNATDRARSGIESAAGTSALAQADNLQGSNALQLLE